MQIGLGIGTQFVHLQITVVSMSLSCPKPVWSVFVPFNSIIVVLLRMGILCLKQALNYKIGIIKVTAKIYLFMYELLYNEV